MPTYCISVTNKDFEAQNDHELTTLDVAREKAIRGALQIGISEVDEDNPFFAAEVKIDQDGEQLARYIVSVGVCSLR